MLYLLAAPAASSWCRGTDRDDPGDTMAKQQPSVHERAAGGSHGDPAGLTGPDPQDTHSSARGTSPEPGTHRRRRGFRMKGEGVPALMAVVVAGVLSAAIHGARKGA
ncbi:hypothetical protein ACI3QN_11165 [Propionibacterium freudenreichii]